MKRLHLLLLVLLAVASASSQAADATARFRTTLVEAILSEDADKQIALVTELVDAEDDLIARGLTAWRASELYLHAPAAGARVPFVLEPRTSGDPVGLRLIDGKPLTDASGKSLTFNASNLTAVENSSKLRKAIKTALDLFAIANRDPRLRRDAVTKLGQARVADYVPFFERRLKIETDKEVIRSLKEAVALTRATDADAGVRLAAIGQLGELRSINSIDFLRELDAECKKEPAKYGEETGRLVHSVVLQLENYIRWGTFVGTAFRGVSLSAVLLVAALGLAITFGLMGVINMAHGEVMAVGAYTAYAVQCLFGNGLLFSIFGYQVSLKGAGFTGSAFDIYFLVALVASFITAALVGLGLERGIIRFLYKRPLESLLATWGVSLVLQQLFRHTFGAANVQVDAPAFLQGSLVVSDIPFAYNRIFIIGFAVFIVFGAWLLLTKTSLGLQIRAVMQNRAMASCLGVRTDRVNMMTFALGSGLAGVAGACMTQIANVGPSLGQSYIVDCFMIVVLGGVGNLVGTVSASAGVGVTNQVLEPWLGAVLGKITVLVAIILFLQWRPAGLFVTRSRSLDG